jgi:FAD synthetase
MPFLSGRIDETEIVRPKIDKKDIKLLSLLAENSRQPLSAISKELKLSRDAVDYRIKRMQKEGIILNFIPILSLENFGYFRFHIFLLLKETDQEKRRQLILDLKRHPNVRNVTEYSGRWDLEVVFIARDVREFDSILSEIVSSHLDIVIEKDKLETIKTLKSAQIPHKLYEDPDIKVYKEESVSKIDLDDKDIHILSILSSDARLSTYKIAEKVGLSPDAVGYRIKNLVDKKIIRKFSVVLNLSRLGFHWYAFAVKLSILDKETEKRFIEFAARHPYILRAVKTLGDWDMLICIVADSVNAFHSTVKEIKNIFSEVIEHYEIWVSYKEHHYNPLPMCLRKSAKKKVLVFGTFDLLHPGHISLFKEAKKLGDHLTVVVARDKTVEQLKKKAPKINEAERLEHVSELSVVDEAILGSSEDRYQVIEEVNPDIICLGYDQKFFTEGLEKELESRGIKARIVRLKPYKGDKYKSSKLSQE